MTEHYHIVPWFNIDEWKDVYEKIFSSSNRETRLNALQTLLIWKARCPSLAAGVESTLTLLEVYSQDEMNSDDILKEQLLRLGYSSAIMRFVNHMLDAETAKGTSLYQAAKHTGVPDWIIDLRHDTAHHNNLPSIDLLREACVFSLDWLKQNYWDKQKLSIANYISGQKDSTVCDEDNKISSLMNFCVSLSICANSKNKIKNLADIDDPDMIASITSDIRDLFGDAMDLSSLKTVSVLGLINLMNSQSKRLLKSRDASPHVSKALLGEESLFLSLDLLVFVNDSDFHNKHKLGKDYVQCFEVLLTFLHTNNLLLDFILELIKISEGSGNDGFRSKLAALWVSEILKALARSRQFVDKVKKMPEDAVSTKKRKELKQLYRHWFPNEKQTHLLLDLQQSVPKELTNINFVQPIISAYNPNLTYFIRDILNLLKPCLPKGTTDKICTLAELISSPEKFPAASGPIYTVDDLEKAHEDVSCKDEEMDSDSDVICESDIKAEEASQHNAEGVWKYASDVLNWSVCPIGILPWQQSWYFMNGNNVNNRQ